MPVIVDASVAIAWRLRDREGTTFADSVIEAGESDELIVPDLFWHEVRNVLLVAEKQGRIELDAVENHLQAIRRLRPEGDGEQDDEQVIALARRHNLSGYDAAYLETAKRRRATLATLDRELANAARDEGVAEARIT